MARRTFWCLPFCACLSAGVILQPDGPIDDFLKNLGHGNAGGGGAGTNPLSQLMPGGIPKMPEIPGIPPESLPSIDQLLAAMNSAVSSFRNTNVSDACMKTISRLETISGDYFRDVDNHTNIFANTAANLTEPDDSKLINLLADFVQHTFDDADEMMHHILQGVRKDILPKISHEAQMKVMPMMVMAEGGIGGLRVMGNDKMEKLKNMTTDDVCQELAGLMNPFHGLKAIQANFSRELPKVDSARLMVPMTVPFIAGRSNSDVVPALTQFISGVAGLASHVGHHLDITLKLFNDKVSPVITDQLKCKFNANGQGWRTYPPGSKRHQSAESNTRTTRPTIVFVFAVLGLAALGF